MKERGHPKPKVYKRIDGNTCEISRLETNPGLKEHLCHTEEGETFELDGISLTPVNTPGHLSDHLCFLMNEGGKYSLFTGDHIIGASSTFFMDYPQYFKSLVKTKNIIYEKNIEKLYGAHTVSLYHKDVAIDAKKKVDEYIDRRSKKDRELEKLADHLSKQGTFSIE
jgi:glyoxylase-like metal-dependent hydrolase (beta-lactamase superfamily II)